jgi:phage nucleotide-binding protein
MLLFSPPGAGKTVFSCTEGKTLLLDCDGNGQSSLLNHPDIEPNVRTLRIKTQTEAIKVASELRADGHDYETVVVDTMSMLQMNDLAYLVKTKYFEWESKGKTGSPRNMYLPTRQDYNEETQRMRDVVVQFMDLPMNVVLTAHEYVKEPEDGDADQTTYIRAALTPALAGTVHALADLTGYLTCDTKMDGTAIRKMRIKPTRRITAKTRIEFGTVELTNPTLKDILTAKRKLVKMVNTPAA